VRRKLPVRNAIEVWQSCPYTRNAVRRESATKWSADLIENLTFGAVSRGQ
jgi:hypothetical protein